MTDPIVPAATKLAAKRGFVRTLSQGYYSALAGLTLSAVGIGLIAVVHGEVDLLPTVVTVAAWLLSPVVGAAASYFDIMSKGIPGDYQTATLAKHSVLTTVEQATDVNHAVEVVTNA